MGISLAGLIQGLTTDATGALQGVRNRQEYERLARQQLLAQRLQEAQLQNYQSEIQRRADQTRIDEEKVKGGKVPPRLVDPVTGTIYERDPQTGEWRPGTMAAPQTPAGSPAQQPTRPARIHPKPSAPHVVYDASGNASFATPGAGGVSVTPIPGAGKPLTDKERVAASRVQSVDRSVDRIGQLAHKNHSALNQAMAAVRASHYGKLGQLLTDLRNTLADPDAQEIYGEINNFILAVSPTYGGARPTEILMNLEQAASLPGVGASDRAIDTALRHMRERTNDIRAQAGRGAPPATPPDTTLGTTTINPRFDPRKP